MRDFLTPLPVELIEHITDHLELNDLLSLRLAQPRVMPSKTLYVFSRKHRWNAKPFSRYSRADPDRVLRPHAKSSTCGLQDCSHCESRRDHTFCATLVALASHTTFKIWISSVYITGREGEGSGYQAWYPGLGKAIASLPALHTLHVRDYAGDTFQIDKVLDEFCASNITPPIRDLSIQSHDSDKYIPRLIQKLRRCLRNVALADVSLLRNGWVDHIHPALRACDLRYLTIDTPWRTLGEPIEEDFVKLEFEGEIGADLHKHVRSRLWDDDPGIVYHLEIEVETSAQWAKAASWLCNQREARLQK